MPTNEKMVEWLKKKIECDMEWMRYIEDLNVDGESFRPGYAETKLGIEIYGAILAALEGPSEEERKGFVEVLYSWWSTYDLSELHKEKYEKIKQLILSGPIVTEFDIEYFICSVEEYGMSEENLSNWLKSIGVKVILGHAAQEGGKEEKE